MQESLIEYSIFNEIQVEVYELKTIM